MKFDTVIIGGGLSGLVCGILLSKQGQRCVVISSGQSALHFSSGSFDLLNTLPDGTRVENPVEAVKDLICQAPEHPYVKLGEEKFAELVGKVPGFLKAAGSSGIWPTTSAATAASWRRTAISPPSFPAARRRRSASPSLLSLPSPSSLRACATAWSGCPR